MGPFVFAESRAFVAGARCKQHGLCASFDANPDGQGRAKMSSANGMPLGRAPVTDNDLGNLRPDNIRILPSELPVKSYVAIPEMRNAVQHSNLRGVPGAAYELPTLNSIPSLDMRINVRGMLPPAPGRFGDGIIGAQAIERKIPLIITDKALKKVVNSLGGQAR